VSVTSMRCEAARCSNVRTLCLRSM
jgi:hypothetical protein